MKVRKLDISKKLMPVGLLEAIQEPSSRSPYIHQIFISCIYDCGNYVLEMPHSEQCHFTYISITVILVVLFVINKTSQLLTSLLKPRTIFFSNGTLVCDIFKLIVCNIDNEIHSSY